MNRKSKIYVCYDMFLIEVSKQFEIGVWFMVFNATFNNIPVISWRSVLLMEETGYVEKTTDL